MALNNKQIIVVSYRFPPMGGVGTRRWSKFTKYLTKKGYLVHVVTIKYPYLDKVNWCGDVKDNPNIVLHRLDPKYPLCLLKDKKGRLSCLLSKFWTFFIKPFFFYIDVAQRWDKSLTPYINKLIVDNNIKDLIVTGPPFSLYYHLANIKKHNPAVNLILDYRDPWNGHINYEYNGAYGLKYMWQKKISVYMERFSLELADKVIVVSKDIKRLINDVCRLQDDKVKVIYNGYDRDDFKDIIVSSRNELSVIYTGTIGYGRTGRLKALELIARAISELNDADINNGLKIKIFSNVKLSDVKFSPYYDIYCKNFTFSPYVTSEEAIRLISDNCYCLSINQESDPHAFGTKIFDYMAMNKKIIHISNGGELSEILVTKKNTFVSDYNIFNIKKLLLDIKKDRILIANDTISEFNRFDITNLTEEVISLLKR